MKRVELLPAFKDNYIFAISDEQEAIVVDPGDASVVLAYLNENRLDLKAILITHQHHDHIGGLAELLTCYPDVMIYAPEKHLSEIKAANIPVNVGDTVSVLGYNFEVFELAGHTKGHVAYYEASQKWLFSGDVLFGLGCGRIFDGTMAQQYQSLQFIKTLPQDTKIFCTHEYTETNWRFLQSVNQPNLAQQQYGHQLQAIREKKLPSVPLVLSSEMESNPFLLATDLEEFVRLRELRNQF